MPRIPIQWVKDLKDPEAKEQFEALLFRSPVLQKLREILDEEIRATTRTAISPDEFSNPSWSHKQAHLNGQLYQLEKIRSLITFSDHQ